VSFKVGKAFIKITVNNCYKKVIAVMTIKLKRLEENRCRKVRSGTAAHPSYCSMKTVVLPQG
jgi:hypothetical protein